MYRFCLASVVLFFTANAASAEPLSVGIAVISLFEATTGIAIGFEAAGVVGFVGSLVIGASLSRGISFGARNNDRD